MCKQIWQWGHRQPDAAILALPHMQTLSSPAAPLITGLHKASMQLTCPRLWRTWHLMSCQVIMTTSQATCSWQCCPVESATIALEEDMGRCLTALSRTCGYQSGIWMQMHTTGTQSHGLGRQCTGTEMDAHDISAPVGVMGADDLEMVMPSPVSLSRFTHVLAGAVVDTTRAILHTAASLSHLATKTLHHRSSSSTRTVHGIIVAIVEQKGPRFTCITLLHASQRLHRNENI